MQKNLSIDNDDEIAIIKNFKYDVIDIVEKYVKNEI